MSTDVSFKPFEKMLRGLDTTADAVSGTLGPCGRNVWIDHPTEPKFTNDGASIAMNVVLEDPLENSGAKILKNTCGQTLDDAGDGTTTSAVLIQAIIHEALKRPENPMAIRESLIETIPMLVKGIKKVSKKISKGGVKEVALISSENEELAENISQIINKIGEDAVITVEDSYDPIISYDITEGYEANVGFMDPRFANDPKKARCVMENVPVLVTEKKIAAMSDVAPLWEQFSKQGISQCVIVCDDIENALLGVFLSSKLHGTFTAVVIRATGDLLKDIEASVGATRVSDLTGVTFQNITTESLGHVKKAIIDANKSIFIPTNPKKCLAYASHLEKFVRNEPNMYIKERLQKRVSQLRGGIAVLKIGTPDFNRAYLKDKADDAIKASKVALKEGVVEGGGMCLYRISKAMRPKTIGEEIMKKALTAPLRKIIENAGKDYAEIVGLFDDECGYDAKRNVIVPLIKNGIIDPTKVTRCAVENSISNASQFITMSASITDHVETKK